jgi:hypothetical protein
MSDTISGLLFDTLRRGMRLQLTANAPKQFPQQLLGALDDQSLPSALSLPYSAPAIVSAGSTLGDARDLQLTANRRFGRSPCHPRHIEPSPGSRSQCSRRACPRPKFVSHRREARQSKAMLEAHLCSDICCCCLFLSSALGWGGSSIAERRVMLRDGNISGRPSLGRAL